MKTRKALYLSLALLFLCSALAATAYAGEGSDTIGACKLMPELRYSYYETPYFTDDLFVTGPGDGKVQIDWKAKEQNGIIQLNWGMLENLDLYGFAGTRIATEIQGRSRDEFLVGPFGIGHVRYAFDLGNGFMCGIGIKGTFYRSPSGFYLGGGLSATYSQTDGMRDIRLYIHDTFAADSLSEGQYFTEKNLAALADLHAGWRIGNTGLTPYLGVEYRWNKSYLTFRDVASEATEEHTFSALHPVGVYVGLDYLLNDRLNFNLEGHMVNRWGGSFSIGYKFDLCGKPELVPPPPPAPAPVIEPKLEPMSQN